MTKTTKITIGTNVFNVPANIAKNVSQQLVDQLKPRKPIKRDVRFSVKDEKRMMQLAGELSQILKRMEKEQDRYVTMFDRDLLPDDEAWLDKQAQRLYKAYAKSIGTLQSDLFE